MVRERDLRLGNLLVQVRVRLGHEGEAPAQARVQQDAETPHVHRSTEVLPAGMEQREGGVAKGPHKNAAHTRTACHARVLAPLTRYPALLPHAPLCCCQASQLGLDRQTVIDAVLGRLKNTAATVYYLIMERYGRKRLQAASEALAAQGHV